MRLIDADRLKEVFRRNTVCDYADIIDNAPTVCDIEQIRHDIENQLFVGRILNSKDFDDGLKWCLELISKYTKGEQTNDRA